MENSEMTNPQDLQIQGLLDRFLRSKSHDDDSAQIKGQHLDENSLTAFTEGTLTEREARPLIGHLVACSFCRHVTKELIKLDLAFADEEAQSITAENQPSKISEVLNNLLSRIFGSGDNAVFAHQENEEENSEKSDSHKDEKR